jgi:hypothetical protein
MELFAAAVPAQPPAAAHSSRAPANDAAAAGASAELAGGSPAVAAASPAVTDGAHAAAHAVPTGDLERPAGAKLSVQLPTPLAERARWAVAFADCTEAELARLAAPTAPHAKG